jgi:phage FluMu gp28-like protein
MKHLLKQNKIMKSKRQLGIWMDHSVAHLIGLNVDSTENNTIIAQVGEQDEALSLRDETLIQNKEQNELSGFFRRISDVIIN